MKHRESCGSGCSHPPPSLLSPRGELSYAVIGTTDDELETDAKVVGTVNARRTTLAELAGGAYSRRGSGFLSLGLDIHIERI